MLVGGTGTGKSTLINRLANHLFGVEYSDEYRFELIPTAVAENQTESQTKTITIYKFFKNSTLHYNLSIIDTPGFGDTRGKKSDLNTVKTIKRLFDSGKVLKLDAIGFVIRYSDVRLSQGQRYVFQSIVEIFSNDVKDNFFVLTTFCDDPDAPSPAQEALKKENIPNEKIFHFNNNRLTSKSILQKAFWEMSSNSASCLLNELSVTLPVSLAMSRELLQKRENAQAKLEFVSEKVKIGLLKVEELQSDQNTLNAKKNEIKNNSNFTYKAKEPVLTMVKTKKGITAIKCKKCNTQCHYPCTIEKEKLIYMCHAMSRFNLKLKIYCTVCPSKCSWKEHFTSNEIAKIEQITVTRTQDDLKAKYDILTGEKNAHEKMIKQMESKITEVYQDLMVDIQEMQDCIKYINEVGMKCKSLAPVTFESHIQKLITAERAENKDNFEKYIKCFEEIIKIAKENKDKEFVCLDLAEKTKVAKAFFEKYA